MNVFLQKLWHKHLFSEQVMAHSYQVAQHLCIPLGALSEGPAEAAHLRRKNSRLNHTRKSSALDHMKDLYYYDLYRSDPVIAKKSNILADKYKESGAAESVLHLPEEAKQLLDIPDHVLELAQELEDSRQMNGGVE